MLLKPSMVVPGNEHAQQAQPAQVAAWTVRILKRTVPAAVPGVFFLSGGQTPAEASAHLDAMNRLGTHPWQLSFSYGRALQDPAMQAWKGQAGNARVTQNALLKRARLNGAAREGKYSPALEESAA